MSQTLYYSLSAVLLIGVLMGIVMMSRVRTAKRGNALSGVCMVAAIGVTLVRYDVFSSVNFLYIVLAAFAGTVLGVLGAYRVKMIQMPQAVALLNGLGGAASAVIGALEWLHPSVPGAFSQIASALALVIGTITFTGSLVAAAKLNGQLKPRPIIWKGHGWLSILSLSVAVLMIAVFRIYLPVKAAVVMALLSGGIFGILFSVRVGGADMPITISLLNSLSGVAAGITGMAIRDPLLVVIGGVVGASGLLLTQIMCRAMNRGLWDILLGIKAAHFETAVNTAGGDYTADAAPQAGSSPEEASAADNPVDWLRQARDVIIVPGYGMALSQAQVCVKELQSALEGNGAAVRYAIHPVAGRMPGHMNVLLAEVDVPYDQLYEIDMINDAFCTCDLCIVIGANDVVNPAANTAVGTPIYGMPILNADGAPRILLLNFDAKPGYAGVDNPLYTRQHGVIPLLGDAKETLERLLAQFRI